MICVTSQPFNPNYGDNPKVSTEIWGGLVWGCTDATEYSNIIEI